MTDHTSPAVPPSESDRIEQVEKSLAKGLQFTNLLSSINQEKNADNTLLLQALVDLLISKGIIHYHELEERKAAVAESIRKQTAETPRVQLVEAADKYAPGQEVLVDCAGHTDTCRMLCCKLWFVLSVQDLSEGVVRWNYGMPYGIAQKPDGFCVHLKTECGGCQVYAQRPLVCRTYDCRTDQRIWQDFDKKILSPEAQEALQRLNAG